MVQQGAAVSFFVDDLAEGGGPPVQQNLRIQTARFVDFNYGGMSPMVTALQLILMTDAGTVITQHYSCGPKERVNHTQDGRRLTAPPAKTSNFGVLMQGVATAGFPQTLLQAGDIACLDGLYAYWDGVTIPRQGLNRPDGSAQRDTIVAVPTKIHQLPGQAGGAAAPAAPSMPGAPAAPGMPAAPAPGMPAPGAPAAPAGAPVGIPGAPAPAPAAAPAGYPPAGVPAAAAPAPDPAAYGVAAPAPAPAPDPAAFATAAPAPAAPAPAPAAAGGINVDDVLAELLGHMTEEVFTKQELTMKGYDIYAANPAVRETITAYMFSAECDVSLNALGYIVEGVNIRRPGM